MFESRVTLLSDYASAYSEKGLRLAGEKGFWQRLIDKLVPKKRSFMVAGIGTEIEFEDLEAEGFAPFCKIEDRYFYVGKTNEACWVAISENTEIWDLSDWGDNSFFVANLLAEVYFMIVRDDYKIDEDERSVFLALVGLLEATGQEISDARNLVYLTLVEEVISDNEVTAEEEATMSVIRNALEIKTDDVNNMHRIAIQEYYNMAIEFSDGDIEILARIKSMADRLGVSIEEIS
jgi:hypothetical protein